MDSGALSVMISLKQMKLRLHVGNWDIHILLLDGWLVCKCIIYLKVNKSEPVYNGHLLGLVKMTAIEVASLHSLKCVVVIKISFIQ